MGNIQGHKHRRRRQRRCKLKRDDYVVCDKLIFVDRDDGKEYVVCDKLIFAGPDDGEYVVCDKLIFVDRDDGEYVWETHVIGRLPFKEPEEPEIVFYGDKLWQDDDGWSMIVLTGDDFNEMNELSDTEVGDFRVTF